MSTCEGVRFDDLQLHELDQSNLAEMAIWKCITLPWKDLEMSPLMRQRGPARDNGLIFQQVESKAVETRPYLSRFHILFDKSGNYKNIFQTLLLISLSWSTLLLTTTKHATTT